MVDSKSWESLHPEHIVFIRQNLFSYFANEECGAADPRRCPAGGEEVTNLPPRLALPQACFTSACSSAALALSCGSMLDPTFLSVPRVYEGRQMERPDTRCGGQEVALGSDGHWCPLNWCIHHIQCAKLMPFILLCFGIHPSLRLPPSLPLLGMELSGELWCFASWFQASGCGASGRVGFYGSDGVSYSSQADFSTVLFCQWKNIRVT